MSDNSQNNKRIVKNTGILYVRMIIMMLVSLYTTRIVLNALGEVNYGIYDVVGGLVAMFTMISSSLSGSVSRFFTFALGKDNLDEQKKVFSTSINIHIILAITIVALTEIFGFWFLNNKMDIPLDRLYAANWVLQCSILSFAVNLMTITYNASIIAYEKMSAFAYMTIYDATSRLAIAIITNYYSGDRLILYALLCLIPSITSLIIYWQFCRRKFEACKYSFGWDKILFKEIFTFAGWNLFGSISEVLKTQGVSIILNIFCGPVVNAARGIATQVNSAVSRFTSNFTIALNPQIIKEYAACNYERVYNLVYNGARFSYFLFLFIAIPIFMEANIILKIWLDNVPQYTVIFTKLILVLSLSEIISNTLIVAQSASGKIKKYQIVIGTITLLNLPISYLSLKIGLSPECTLIIAIIISQICLVARLILLKEMINLPIIGFIKKVFVKILLVTLVSIFPPMLIMLFMQENILRLILLSIISFVFTAIFILYIGCTNTERQTLFNIINKIKSKLHLHK